MQTLSITGPYTLTEAWSRDKRRELMRRGFFVVGESVRGKRATEAGEVDPEATVKRVLWVEDGRERA